ncbi:MAG: DNA repair protein RadA, partial [Lachnospiraceae bacterium]
MMKAKQTAFFCKECGYESAKWMGQCPGCRQWNTFVEEPTAGSFATTKSGGAKKQGLEASKPLRLEEISTDKEDRSSTGLHELDRVLGGGLVTGSLILVGGDPGIGKSTLLLQVCRNLAVSGKKVLYVSGEESARQVKMRADRLGGFSGELLLLSETNLEKIDNTITKEMPQVVVIDSIQTMYREDISSAPGSVSQVRECTNTLMQIAKGRSITIFLVGHVTKEGVVAGPRVLEHMVDTVLYFEGDRSAMYRILRAVKNRFGATNEMGVFEMVQSGLKEVANPSAYLLEGRSLDSSGTVTACLMEGTRPIMLEVQALVCRTSFGLPRRTSAGIDGNRVNLLIAVLEKRMGMALSSCDAYVNVTGGIKISEPALDLAVVMAIAGSFRDRVIDAHTVIFGEVGLAGEIRGVS